MSAPLGKQVDYPKAYNPGLLAPIRREENRSRLGIDSARLPFCGADIWNAYELSWLDGQGKPCVARGRFIFDCTSPCLIESKSLKLYLNSLNQHRFADIEAARATIAADLSKAAQSEVQVVVQPFSGMQEMLEAPDGICLDKIETGCDTYEVDAGLLQAAETQGNFHEVEEVLYTDAFRSLCPVTGQPDWATLVVCYRGGKIDHAALLRYLVSYREHGDFHESCVERIFLDIQRVCRPRQLGVEANFLRRGGLDINPVRSSDDSVNYMLLPRYNRQ